MKGYNYWSYSPYKPILKDAGNPYICRIVPSENAIHFEWLEKLGAEVFYRKRGEGEFLFYKQTTENFCDIEGLEKGEEYEFYAKIGESKSLTRLARVGENEGTVIEYLHPQDTAYSFSGKFLASPSMVRHPDGYLLVSMDVFAGNYPQNLTRIFRSDDDGKTWQFVSELMPCFWGKMFIHKGELYMLANSAEYGDLLISKSTDGGKTFLAPVCLFRGSNGRNGCEGIHRNPENIFIHNGRLYNSVEWGCWGNLEYAHAAAVVSCSVDDDLLVPENWTLTEPVKYNPNWPGTVDGEARGMIEGTICLSPSGKLLNVMRYCITNATPSYGLVIAFEIDTNNPETPLTYSHCIKMPCNNSKFIIKFDEKSKNYYSIVTRIDCEERIHRRNLLSLMRSTDLENWEVVCDLIDKRSEDINKVGFQYVDFEFEGDDIIFVCRTSQNGADTYHNSNYITFHKINNFRNL
jgi:hypothetical protein